jgi:hypothetical protein
MFFLNAARGEPSMVAPAGPLLVNLIGQFVASDAGQELDELIRLLQIVLPQSRTGEETGENRLTDVHGIEDAPQSVVAQIEPHRPANVRLILPHQFGRGVRVPRADSVKEIPEGIVGGHGEFPDG